MEPPTVREVIRRLEREGWQLVNTEGSHRQYVKGSRKVTVAGKPGEHLRWRTRKSICMQAGW